MTKTITLTMPLHEIDRILGPPISTSPPSRIALPTRGWIRP
ncbi:hypothetical protein X749_20625 [Mesorhizobium sp. LNJC391B00]|nr:hypothetical protein X749_20625 [Mesorhizobium sp. LNJC391B00]